MARRFLLLTLCALVGCGAAAQAVAAKGLEPIGAAGDVTVDGSPYRYVAISPGFPGKLTVVERIDRRGGRVSRWWYLRGSYYVPAVAYDGSAGGLSADGTTLVLTRFPDYYLNPATTRLAILKTGRVTRLPERHRPRRWVRFVELRGDFRVDAISPDGSTVFLTHYLEPARPGAHLGASEIRALDTASGRLLPAPVLATEEPKGQRRDRHGEALPISGANSPDGRWAYTLYGGNGQAPFIEALDTTRRRPVAFIDLPQLKNRRNPFLLKLRVVGEGRRILVLGRSPVQGGRPRPLLLVDRETSRVRKLTPPATSAGGTSPWPPTGLASVVLALGIAWAADLDVTAPASGFLAFTQTPRRPGNLLERTGIAGRSAGGRPIRMRQLGDPAIDGKVLVFDCIHGDECAATGRIQPLANGCPDPNADIYIVPDLNPDGFRGGTRLNGRGVDLNRNFAGGWLPIGERGDPEYAGPRPFSEPEARLAARIVEALRPEVTLWFHQDDARRPFVRAWGQSVPIARRFARLAGLRFRLMRWLAGTAPNWQNHRFPGTSSFVVELPPGPLANALRGRLSSAVDRLAEQVSKG